MSIKRAVPPELIEPRSAFQRHLGYRLTHWDDGYARFEQPLEAFLMNRAGIPHGGNYATLLDTVMGYSGVFTGRADRKMFSLTLSLNVNFVAKPEGDLLIAEGEVTGGGAKTFFAEARILDKNDRLIAHGTGAFQRRES